MDHLNVFFRHFPKFLILLNTFTFWIVLQIIRFLESSICTKCSLNFWGGFSEYFCGQLIDCFFIVQVIVPSKFWQGASEFLPTKRCGDLENE